MLEGRTKVLAVDDDAVLGQIFGKIGERNGFDIVVANNCHKAFSELQRQQFDIILMDWKLPDMDGMECVRIIRKEQAQYTAIVAVTACAFDRDHQACLAAGCDDYLSKPFELDEFTSKIERWSHFVSERRQTSTSRRTVNDSLL